MKYFFSCLCIFTFLVLHTTATFADVPSPERTKRNNEVRNWNQKFSHLNPELNANLDQKNKMLVIEVIFKSPATYDIVFGKEKIIDKKITSLDGKNEKIKVPLKQGNNRSDLLILSFTLTGVEKLGNSLHPTNKHIFAKIVKKYSIRWDGDNVNLQEERLSTPEYHMIQRPYKL